ncbi:MAG: hypothetical protein LBB53_03895 [Prevotellaceae bacterium]|nr:hypothetical protein [Prevotellaceae bacterium]
MKKFFRILFFSIFLCSNFFAAEKICYDNEPFKTRSLPQPPSQVYTVRDFQYNEPMRQPDIFERIWTKIIDFINKIFDWNLRADSNTGRQILWITAATLFMILFSIGAWFTIKKFGKNLDRGDKMLLPVDEVERNLAETNIDKLIETAVNQGNYQFAVRFCYLKTLKTLSEKQAIEYQYQKTNHEYIYEIQNENLKAKFSEISFIFDYYWYGSYPVSQEDFLLMKKLTMNIE